MHSPDLTQRNIDALAELFPAAITETVDADGKVMRAVDFDALRQELSDHIVEGPQERYQLDWPGKRDAAFKANAPIAKTLRPERKDSVNFDTTQNLFIEGDNLDVLKLLQESYLGKVRLIYIDPPYNTGNDFVYNDDFAETTDEFLTRSGQVDDGGSRLIANLESNGRFHSDWLSMMYPRLRLARNLLTPDGLIFVSIADNEVSNLQKICDEVFGEQNFVAAAPRKTGAGSAATRSQSALRKLNDFVLIYTRSDQAILRRKLVGKKEYPHEDEGGRYLLGQFQASGSDATRTARPRMWYPIYANESGELTTVRPSGASSEILPAQVDGEDGRWLWSPEKFEADKGTLIHFDGKVISRKIYFDPTQDQSVYQVERAWFDEFTNASGTKEVEDLFGRKKVFDHPKPTSLVKHLINLHPNKDALVLDFFAGSATTAHATMALNSEDGGHRRFVMVQLDESVDPGSMAARAGFASISELARERIRRAAEKVAANAGLEAESLDLGFRALRIDSTNLSEVLRTPDALDQSGLAVFADSVKANRTGEDLLFQVLLDWGLELTMAIATEEIDGRVVFTAGDGVLIACFDPDVSPTLVREVAARKPLRAVFRDSGFATDADRINAEQVFAEVSPGTDVKAI